MSGPPPCGAQQPGTVTSPFKWPVLGEIATAVGILGVIIKYSTTLAHSLAAGAGAAGAAIITASAAGALSIAVVVFYYAFQADGCIISPTNNELICLSGIVQDTAQESSTVIYVLAPFAIGSAGLFDLVMKTIYLGYVSTSTTRWVYCNGAGAPMLPCLIKSKGGCGAKIGAVVGVIAGAIVGTIVGAIAGTAIVAAGFCALAFIFYLICLLLAVIIAAIVAAAIAYGAAAVGGAIGEGIGDATNNNDPVNSAFESLQAGAIVTVKGNWVMDPNVGNNELFYVTSVSRTGQFATAPDYTTANADSTAADDCPIASQPIQ